MNTFLRLSCLAATFLFPCTLQAQQEKGEEKPPPQSLADCEKTPPEPGTRWEYDRGIKECTLHRGELERCLAGLICKSDDSDYSKGNKHLVAMKELSLFDEAATNRSAEEYRLTWLRTFHSPVVIRIVLTRNGGTFITKMTSGQGGYSAGHLILNKTRTLTSDEANDLHSRIEGMHFWDMYSLMNDPNEITVDGSSWVLEGVKDGHYHRVSRASPGCESLVRQFGLELMLERAKLKLLYQDVY